MKASIDLPDGLVVVAPPPEFVSQLNVEAVVGLPVAAFLELLRDPGCPSIVRVGRTRMVDRVAFVAWLKARQGQEAQPANDAGGKADDFARLDEAFGFRPAKRGR